MSPTGRRSAERRDGPAPGPFRLVSFHAHPDDEALLTGGTLARAARDGHRVVLVTATGGGLGLAGRDDGHGDALARRRLDELQAAAHALGCSRVVCLGYGDSGLEGTGDGPTAFAHVDVDLAAARLAEVLVEEDADVLTTYDANGGYGHPDHVQVHRVGARAAELAGTPVVLEATVPADLFRLVLRALRFLRDPMGSSAPLGTERVFSRRRDITHRVRVVGSVRAKRAAMAAHGSQRRADGQRRVLDRFVTMPVPLFALVFGREWFVQSRGPVERGRRGDVFGSLRREPPGVRDRTRRGAG